MKLTPRKCPCGCKKVILEPLCGCRCSSVAPEEAREVMVKVNHHDDLVAALKTLVLNRRTPGLVKMGQDVLDAVEKELAAPPDFPTYPWAQR
jgi:hypothetical protein